jgi:hypothetical protein
MSADSLPFPLISSEQYWQRSIHPKSIPASLRLTTMHRLIVELVDFNHAQHFGPFELEKSVPIALKRDCGIAMKTQKR